MWIPGAARRFNGGLRDARSEESSLHPSLTQDHQNVSNLTQLLLTKESGKSIDNRCGMWEDGSMKPLGYFETIKFSIKANGPFGFYNLTNHKSDRSEIYWSDEDFGYIRFDVD